MLGCRSRWCGCECVDAEFHRRRGRPSGVNLAQADEEVARDLEAQPATGHAGGNFEKIRHDAFVHSSDALLCDDDLDGVPDGLVLVADAGHGVDLETTAEDVAGTGQSGYRGRHRKAYKGYVHVCATAPEMAPEASFRTALGLSCPSGVRYLRTAS